MGYRCQECGECFEEDDADECGDSELLDDMNDRPATREDGFYPACPECGSCDLVDARICDHCHAAQALPGTDFCKLCVTLPELQ